MVENNVTQVWKLYERGRNYNESLTPNQYDLVDTNCEFFIGNQWLHLPDSPAMRDLPKPVFNILKRVASLFVASLTSSGVAVRYDTLAYYDGSNIEDPDHDAVTMVNAMVTNLFEKMKMDYRVREALFDGAQTGDYCAHFWFDPDARPYGSAFGPYRGEIKMELVDGVNVHFGNPHTTDVQAQPYILLIGRAPIDALREISRRVKANQDVLGRGGAFPGKMELDSIQSDWENQNFPGVGGKKELLPDDGDGTGQALYGLLYTKVTEEQPAVDADGQPIMEEERDANGDPVFELTEDGTAVIDEYGLPVRKLKQATTVVTSVHATMATRTTVIYEDLDTGLSLYPIAWGTWEKQKNQYHGRALVTGLVPNQIFINVMFATAMRHLQLMAFPKTIYNADLISDWTNEVGQSIGIHGLAPGQPISQVAMNLQPAEMSNQIFALIDKAMAYTKECLGATDAQMGNVKPDNTSALMVLQTNSEVPLENIHAGLFEWVESIGEILPDMMGTYYGSRPVIVEEEFEEPITGPGGAPMLDPMTGQMQTQKVARKVKKEFDFSQLKHIALNLSIDVGATTYFSEIAMTQTMDNLRHDGTLDVIQYLERVPDKLIPKKAELINEIKGRMAAGTQANAAAGAAIPEPGSPVSGGGPAQGGVLDPTKAQQGLPVPSMAGFDSLPSIAQKTALAQGAMRAE